ncbi:MAG: aminoacyl-tRNA hydrolase, partial [Chloroflexi bacterium]|nr:aminoacyl-tRNA hydrolase [Chloroflexota bacterium]
AKPQTYTNKSGGPVGALVRFYKLDPANLLVVGDHLDLEAGTLRMRPSGGSGGLNGIKDIIRHLGTEEFARLRIGIGRPPGKMDPAAYVLQDFKGDEIALFKEVRERAADAIESWLTEGIELAMSRHNGPITL